MGLTPEELKLIGGSDAAAIVGVSPYASAHDVYARIVEGAVTEETRPMRRGTLLEPVIRSMAAEELGMKFLGPRKLRFKGWGRASLDDVALVDGAEEVAEFKSVGPFADGEYGEPGTDAIPPQHVCQVQVYMAATGMPRANLVALFGTDDLRQYVVPADAELQGMLFEAMERFWVDNVLTRTPPLVDGSSSCAEALARRFPKVTAPLLPADKDAETWAQILREARAAKDAAESAEKNARNHLLERIGDAEGIEGAGWRITYKETKGKPSVDWQALCFEAKVPPELVKKFTKRTPYRVFRPSGPLFKDGTNDE